MRELNKEDINNLPKKYGFGANKDKQVIDWISSVGYKIKFTYDDIEGVLEIVSYNPKNQSLFIRYLNKDIFEINSWHFLEGKLGKLLGKYTNEFKVEIGTRFKDDNRDLIIINMEYRSILNKKGWKENQKWYNYKCLKCGWDEGYVKEINLLKGYGCSCCRGLAVVEGINDVTTTASWMIPYFQGGYDEAAKYTHGSYYKIYPKCPDCGRVRKKLMNINTIYREHSIACSCSDSISYPEKLTFNVLEQLNINFQNQLTKITFSWCDKYRYDFYFEINNEKYIIETHGLQHYEENNRKMAKKLKQEQENDKFKKELVLKNGIKQENYIVIDCRESELEYIKNNILNSKLNDLFDLSQIDWFEAESFALSNLCKKACELKRNNPNMSSLDIGKVMKLGRTSIIRYLKKGTKIGWCNYNPKEELLKTASKNGKLSSKPVEIFDKNDMSLGKFKSAQELENLSEKLFGKKITVCGISSVCLGKLKTHKGYTMKFI